MKGEYPLEASAKQIKEGNILLLDLRPADKFAAAHIERALNLPLSELKSSYSEASFPDYKGSLIVFTSDNKEDLDGAMEMMRDWGFTKATTFLGTKEHWSKEGLAVTTGKKPAPAKLTYARVLGEQEISIADFKKALADKSVLIVDARSTDEFKAGHFPGALNIPSEEAEKRYAEIPMNTTAYIHCSSGSRAEMLYDILKGKKYTAIKILKANVDFAGNSPTIKE